MAYSDCRDHIKGVLETLEITDPVEASIATVYEQPPETIEDTPCFLMFDPAGRIDWSAGGQSTDGMEVEEELCTLVIQDEDYAQALAVLRAFRAALITAFKTEQGMGSYGIISGIRWDRPEPFPWAGGNYVGQDFTISFTVTVT